MGGLEEYTLVATYLYEDEHGTLLYERGCFHAAGAPRRRRRFRERRHPDEDWNRAHEFLIGEVRRVPYRLPELLTGVAARRTVYLCEGEKDVDALRQLGLVATTTFAQPGVWSDSYARLFAGSTVVVLPDNDDQGRRYAELLQRALCTAARAVAVVELPGLHVGEDVSDWLARGGSLGTLAGLVMDALSTTITQGGRPKN